MVVTRDGLVGHAPELGAKKCNRGKFPGGGGRSQSLESMIEALDDSALGLIRCNA